MSPKNTNLIKDLVIFYFVNIDVNMLVIKYLFTLKGKLYSHYQN